MPRRPRPCVRACLHPRRHPASEDAGYAWVQPAEDVTHTGNCFRVTNYRRDEVKSQGWISANDINLQPRPCQAVFWFQTPLKQTWLSNCQIKRKPSVHLEWAAYLALCLQPSDKKGFSLLHKSYVLFEICRCKKKGTKRRWRKLAGINNLGEPSVTSQGDYFPRPHMFWYTFSIQLNSYFSPAHGQEMFFY